MEKLINNDTYTNMKPVTLFIVEDSDLGDSLLSDTDFASVMLNDGNSLERAGHLFSCHDRWSYGRAGVRVDSMASYMLSLSQAIDSQDDLICIVDCYLGENIRKEFQSPFIDATHLPEHLLRNTLSHPGIAFAKNVLDQTATGDRFVFVTFANLTIHDKLWAGLKEHTAWNPHHKRFDYIPSLPSACDTIDDLRGAVSQAIDLFLEAKGFGTSAEDRMREGTQDWFPPIKP